MDHRPGPRRPAGRALWSLVATVAVVLAIGAALLLGRSALLTLSATEGDAPTAEDMHFPEPAVVTATSKDCGSGGCWTTFTLEPVAGTTTDELEAAIGDSVPGTLLDPRSITVTVQRDGDSLTVRGDYWTEDVAP